MSLVQHPSLVEMKRIHELKVEALNNSAAFRKYEEAKKQHERNKKQRIDKILDQLGLEHLNIPQSNYRSDQPNLVYKPYHYNLSLIQPFQSEANGYIGFNQLSKQDLSRKLFYQGGYIPQQLNYQQRQPYVPAIDSHYQQIQSGQLPPMQLENGNLGYEQSYERIPVNQPMYQKEVMKQDFINRADQIDRRARHYI